MDTEPTTTAADSSPTKEEERNGRGDHASERRIKDRGGAENGDFERCHEHHRGDGGEIPSSSPSPNEHHQDASREPGHQGGGKPQGESVLAKPEEGYGGHPITEYGLLEVAHAQKVGNDPLAGVDHFRRNHRVPCFVRDDQRTESEGKDEDADEENRNEEER